MKRTQFLCIGLLVVTSLLFCGCIGREEATPRTGEPQAMGNPASLYCQSLGFQNAIRTDANGSQYGVCCMPNGTEVDEWELYRSAHQGIPQR